MRRFDLNWLRQSQSLESEMSHYNLPMITQYVPIHAQFYVDTSNEV